ncbi:MAG: hypothetical protein LCH86_22300 [Proteobacteria bacterium]|nr:hypothetical protein [Pseudomonadota bacterium]
MFGKKNENAAVVVEIARNVAAHFACGTGMWRDGLRVSVAKARPAAARAACPERAAQATPGRCAPPFGRTPDQNGVSDGNTIIVADIVRNA